MATLNFVANCLATIILIPGPNILKTLFIVSVPNVKPIMACIPPTL